MDHLLSSFVSRRFSSNNRPRQNSTSSSASCDNVVPDISKKRMLKRAASFGSRHSLPSPSNSELISVVDAHLKQIREKLAGFREQDTQFKERMDWLSDSLSELTSSRSSISSFTPSECAESDGNTNFKTQYILSCQSVPTIQQPR